MKKEEYDAPDIRVVMAKLRYGILGTSGGDDEWEIDPN